VRSKHLEARDHRPIIFCKNWLQLIASKNDDNCSKVLKTFSNIHIHDSSHRPQSSQACRPAAHNSVEFIIASSLTHHPEKYLQALILHTWELNSAPHFAIHDRENYFLRTLGVLPLRRLVPANLVYLSVVVMMKMITISVMMVMIIVPACRGLWW